MNISQQFVRIGALLSALLLSATALLAADESPRSETMQARYASAATRLVDELLFKLDTANFKPLADSQRNAVRGDLTALSNALKTIFRANSNFISDLKFYLRLAKDLARPIAERDLFWNQSIVPEAQKIERAVAEASAFLKNGAPITVALPREQVMALDDVLGTRAVVLRKLSQMHPPSAAHGLLEFEALIAQYDTLYASLGKLRVSVDAALERL